MFENIPRRIGKFAHITEETTCWACPDCNSPVAAMMVLPNDKRQLVMLGRCTVCYEQGDKRTSYAYIRCHPDAWLSIMAVDGLPCLRSA